MDLNGEKQLTRYRMYIAIFSRFLEIPDNVFLVPTLHLNPAHVATSYVNWK